MTATLPIIVHRTAIDAAARTDGHSLANRDEYGDALIDAARHARLADPDATSWVFELMGSAFTAATTLRKGQPVVAVHPTTYTYQR